MDDAEGRERRLKIREILAVGKPTLSFEVFPPKTEDAYDSVEKAAAKIAKLKPSFMSVTYGAGGGTIIRWESPLPSRRSTE